MTLNFYNLIQDTLQHSVDIISLSETEKTISGLSFHKQEARNCKFTFFEDSWCNSNLRDSQDIIGNTGILKLVIKFSIQDSERVYYLPRSDIKYNKKTGIYSVSGIDLLGLLLTIGLETKDFSCNRSDSLELLGTTIDNILAINTDIQYIIDSNAVSQETSITDFIISDLDFTGQPINEQDNNYGEYEATIRWRYIGEAGAYDNPVFLLVDWEADSFDPDEEDLRLGYHYYFGELVDEVILQEIMSEQKDLSYSSQDNADSVWEAINNIFGTYGFPGTNQLTHSVTAGNYAITDSILYYTGTVYFDETQLQEEDEDSNILNAVQNDILKALLSLNNLYLYANANTLYIGNKSEFSGSVTNISDNDMVEYEEDYISFDQKTFDSDVKVLVRSDLIARFLEQYYDALRTQLNTKAAMGIVNNYDLDLLDIINVYGGDYVITKINIDNDNFIYEIEAWSI